MLNSSADILEAEIIRLFNSILDSYNVAYFQFQLHNKYIKNLVTSLSGKELKESHKKSWCAAIMKTKVV